MKILIFSAYYEPEKVSSLNLSIQLYENLARKYNHYIDLIVPMPTRGVDKEIRRKYKEKKEESKYNNHLNIHRISLFNEYPNMILRALRYILMNFIFIIKGCSFRPDVIFIQSTPPTQGAMACILKKLLKVPVVYNLQDIFPDSMISADLCKKENIIYKLGKVIENYTYRNVDKIITVSNSMVDNLLLKGVPLDKIEMIYNWVNKNEIVPIDRENNELFEEFKIEKNNFNIVYAGNIGYAQNIQLIVETAERLQEYKDICFIIFGDGKEKDKIIDYINEKQLVNVKLYPLLEKEFISKVYSLGSASIVICKKGFGGIAMPSKFPTILSTGTPVLASFDEQTDIEELINSKSLGLFSPSNDIEELKNNIIYLYKNYDFLLKCKNNARNIAISLFDIDNSIFKYNDILTKIVEDDKI